jgi:hypothetical protein
VPSSDACPFYGNYGDSSPLSTSLTYVNFHFTIIVDTFRAKRIIATASATAEIPGPRRCGACTDQTLLAQAQQACGAQFFSDLEADTN